MENEEQELSSEEVELGSKCPDNDINHRSNISALRYDQNNNIDFVMIDNKGYKVKNLRPSLSLVMNYLGIPKRSQKQSSRNPDIISNINESIEKFENEAFQFIFIMEEIKKMKCFREVFPYGNKDGNRVPCSHPCSDESSEMDEQGKNSRKQIFQFEIFGKKYLLREVWHEMDLKKYLLETSESLTKFPSSSNVKVKALKTLKTQNLFESNFQKIRCNETIRKILAFNWLFCISDMELPETIPEEFQALQSNLKKLENLLNKSKSLEPQVAWNHKDSEIQNHKDSKLCENESESSSQISNILSIFSNIKVKPVNDKDILNLEEVEEYEFYYTNENFDIISDKGKKILEMIESWKHGFGAEIVKFHYPKFIVSFFFDDSEELFEYYLKMFIDCIRTPETQNLKILEFKNKLIEIVERISPVPPNLYYIGKQTESTYLPWVEMVYQKILKFGI